MGIKSREDGERTAEEKGGRVGWRGRRCGPGPSGTPWKAPSGAQTPAPLLPRPPRSQKVRLPLPPTPSPLAHQSVRSPQPPAQQILGFPQLWPCTTRLFPLKEDSGAAPVPPSPPHLQSVSTQQSDEHTQKARVLVATLKIHVKEGIKLLYFIFMFQSP